MTTPTRTHHDLTRRLSRPASSTPPPLLFISVFGAERFAHAPRAQAQPTAVLPHNPPVSQPKTLVSSAAIPHLLCVPPGSARFRPSLGLLDLPHSTYVSQLAGACITK
ncbi:hypothetical protein VPH35_117311 [Triticum aestivum]